MNVLAIVAALGLAFVLGVGDAPNATATLLANRAGRRDHVMAASFTFHVIGGLLGGTAVAKTVVGILDVPTQDVAPAYAAASLAAVVFMAVCAWTGLPASASYGLIGGLVGAGLVAGGTSAVNWGGIEDWRPVGVVGALIGLVITPLVGVAAASLALGALNRTLRRATQRVGATTDRALWVSAMAVAFADGTNDGQKAMGLIVGVLLASGTVDGSGIPFLVRAAVAVVLASGTVLGGRRVVETVSKGFYRFRSLEGLAAQSAAAVVILASGVMGAPISTSNVVTAGIVGVGADHRPRHVRWMRVYEVGGAWVVSVPVCAILGAILFACLQPM